MKFKRWSFPLILLIFALVAAGCSGGGSSANARSALRSAASWAGMSYDEEKNIVYFALAADVFAIDPATCDSNGCDTEWQYQALAEKASFFGLGRRQPVQFFAVPAFTADMVVVGDYLQTLHAIDAESGEQVWTFSTDRARFIGGATFSEDGETVYVGDAHGVLYALDASDGNLEWQFATGGGIWDAPLLDDGTLYVASLDHNLYAVDAASGRQIWEFDAAGAVVGTPALHEGTLYFGDLDRSVFAIDAATGRQQWRHETAGWVWDTPAIAGDLLVIGDLDGELHSLKLEDGNEVWTVTDEETPGQFVGTPVISDDLVYTADSEGRVYALNLANGREEWQVTVQIEFPSRFLFFTTGSSLSEVPIYTSPLLVGDDLMMGLHQGSIAIQALDVSDEGDVAWSFSPEGAGQAVVNSASGEDPASEEEEISFQERLTRLLPIYAVMTILWIVLLRRRNQQPDKK